MDLEGNLMLERAPTRRWVSIVAVTVPVAAIVMLSAWFIRSYIAPPMITIPNPMIVAAAPPVPPAPAKVEAAPPAPEPPQPAAAAPATASSETPPATLPMFATLSAAPPTLENAPVAFADPVQDAPAAPATTVEAALEPSEPIAGPVPLPRMKPRVSIALADGPVPLPRPRPADNTPPPVSEIPSVDLHGIE